MEYLLAFGLLALQFAIIFGCIWTLMWARDRFVVLPLRDDPHLIFRLVKRDDRAAYTRIMRRTLAVAMRDMNRQVAMFGREIGKVLLPSMQRLADALSEAFGKR